MSCRASLRRASLTFHPTLGITVVVPFIRQWDTDDALHSDHDHDQRGRKICACTWLDDTDDYARRVLAQARYRGGRASVEGGRWKGGPTLSRVVLNLHLPIISDAERSQTLVSVEA